MNSLPPLSRRATSLAIPILMLTVLGVGHAAGDGLTININPGPGLLGNQAALDAFNRAANTWSTRIDDDIVVNIDADLIDLGAGSTIGQTSSSDFIATEPNEFRDVMVADAADEPDDTIVSFLPDMADYTAILPDGFSVARLPLQEGGQALMSATRANLKALGFPAALLDSFDDGAADGTINFNSQFSFDFDNSNGVDFDKIDFESAAAHEIGHALGFISIVDDIDALVDQSLTGTVYPTTLDVFRFENGVVGHDPSTAAEFQSFPRYLLPGGSAITDQIWGIGESDAELPMSTGAFTGDGNQASHWLDDSLNQSVMIGMMDPSIAFGQTFTVTDADLRALDLIGYEIAVPEPSTFLLSILGLGLLAWRWWRRR
ncbi:MAG: NF038122 family metalloprotease [Thermoguttaceae bacterium]